MAAARLSAANLAGDGTPVLNFLQMQLFLTEALESVCLRSPCLGTYFMSCFTNLYLIKSSSFLLFWKVAASCSSASDEELQHEELLWLTPPRCISALLRKWDIAATVDTDEEVMLALRVKFRAVLRTFSEQLNLPKWLDFWDTFL